MSVPAEALAPQPDAHASPDAAPPNGGASQTESAADPSSAAAVKPSDNQKGDPFQSRIDELTRLRHDERRSREQAERDRDHWRELVLRNQRESAPAPQPQAPSAAKTLADFNFDEGAFRAYEREEISRLASEAAKKELMTAQEAQAKQRRDADFVARAKEFAKGKSDFREVAYNAPISDAVAETIKGIEQGPELAYYLGKEANAEVAHRLNSFPPNVAAYELGLLAARLKYEREAAAAAAKKVSAAPPPEPTIDGSDPGASVDPTSADSDKLSDAEWQRRREKQIQKQRKR